MAGNNCDNYQQQSYEEVSSGHQGGCMSFSYRGHHDHPTGYHEQQMEYARFDTRLTTIEENQQEIWNTLHQHSQWQEEAGQRLVAIQQQENYN